MCNLQKVEGRIVGVEGICLHQPDSLSKQEPNERQAQDHAGYHRSPVNQPGRDEKRLSDWGDKDIVGEVVSADGEIGTFPGNNTSFVHRHHTHEYPRELLAPNSPVQCQVEVFGRDSEAGYGCVPVSQRILNQWLVGHPDPRDNHHETEAQAKNEGKLDKV